MLMLLFLVWKVTYFSNEAQLFPSALGLEPSNLWLHDTLVSICRLMLRSLHELLYLCQNFNQSRVCCLSLSIPQRWGFYQLIFVLLWIRSIYGLIWITLEGPLPVPAKSGVEWAIPVIWNLVVLLFYVHVEFFLLLKCLMISVKKVLALTFHFLMFVVTVSFLFVYY